MLLEKLFARLLCQGERFLNFLFLFSLLLAESRLPLPLFLLSALASSCLEVITTAVLFLSGQAMGRRALPPRDAACSNTSGRPNYPRSSPPNAGFFGRLTATSQLTIYFSHLVNRQLTVGAPTIWLAHSQCQNNIIAAFTNHVLCVN